MKILQSVQKVCLFVLEKGKGAERLLFNIKRRKRLNKSFPIFRTIDFYKKMPILSRLQIPTCILTGFWSKNRSFLQIKSAIKSDIGCQIISKTA